MSSRTVVRTTPRNTPVKPGTKRERSPTGPLSNMNTNEPPAKTARTTPAPTPRSVKPKTAKPKTARRKLDPAAKTARSITATAAREVSKAINKLPPRSRRTAVIPKPMIPMEDLLDIYQLYLAIVNQRHIILGSDIASTLTDEQVNKVFVDMMELQLKGARNANKFSNFLRLMNYVCRVGRATSYLLLRADSSNTGKIIKNAYVLKNEMGRLTYESIQGKLSKRDWLDAKSKLESLGRRGARWLKVPTLVEFQNESSTSVRGGEVFYLNPSFMGQFRKKDFNATFKSLIETFKETNDFLGKLQNMLKSNDFEHKQLRQLFKASAMPTNNSLKILELLRSRN